MTPTARLLDFAARHPLGAILAATVGVLLGFAAGGGAHLLIFLIRWRNERRSLALSMRRLGLTPFRLESNRTRRRRVERFEDVA